jgi:hypothetical protein
MDYSVTISVKQDMIGSNEADLSYLKYRSNQRKQNGTLLSITRDNLVTITLSQEPC